MAAQPVSNSATTNAWPITNKVFTVLYLQQWLWYMLSSVLAEGDGRSMPCESLSGFRQVWHMQGIVFVARELRGCAVWLEDFDGKQ